MGSGRRLVSQVSCAYWVFQPVPAFQNSNVHWFAGAMLSNMATTGCMWWLTFQLKKMNKFSSSLTSATFWVLSSHKQLLLDIVFVSAEYFRLHRTFPWTALGVRHFSQAVCLDPKCVPWIVSSWITWQQELMEIHIPKFFPRSPESESLGGKGLGKLGIFSQVPPDGY